MRSKLVSLANGNVRNRFLLCHLASKATRKLHYNSAPVHESINDVLSRLADGRLTESPRADVKEEAEELNIPVLNG
jgi:hypothetical protein